MKTSNLIYEKLEAFIRKYYTNELIRGSLLFVGLGLLYFLFTLSVEYFLWLKPSARSFLFWLFILVELFLIGRFILWPISKLLKLQKGIGYDEASKIIGSHFSEVNDKLTNFLQLSSDRNQSELLLASIEQKAGNLQPVPFGNAINFKKNRKFLPLAILPLLFVAFFYISGNDEFLSQSLNRVVNYKQQFLPPAPFRFVLLNDKLQTEQNQDFVLRIKTEGRVVPENAMVFIGDESYFMESERAGEFQFRIPKPGADMTFHVEANTVRSNDYELSVVTVPSIANFEMVLDFPDYLGKRTEVIKGTGNAILPEGTRVTWKMSTRATQNVDWKNDQNNFPFAKSQNHFTLSKQISQNTDYQILTSNSKVANYETLNYRISVIKDQFPTITVGNAPDTLKVGKNYILGQVADDYGLTKLQVVYYPKGNPAAAKRGTIAVKRDVFDQFVFAFPSTLPVDEGVSYDYYFEVFDNDAPHGFKSSRSSVFSDRIATEQEKQDEVLQQQNSNINSLEKSLKNQEKQMSELDKLRNSGKEKDNLEFKDQQKVNDFIKRQKQQDEMMKEFSKKLEENLDKFQPDKKDEFKEELQRRLDKQEKDLEKNQKLLDELKELNDKISKEELFEKMDQFKQNAKNQSKSLEQLVELTKRYYVEKKAEQIADKLEKLAEKQDKLSENEQQNKSDKQEEINKEFDKIQEEKEQLEQDNKELKSPLDIPNTDNDEKSIEDDMKKASDELKKDSPKGAKPKQKSAAKKMKEMGNNIMQMMGGGEMEQMEEDVKMLRQILDNLLAFSFSEEDLMKDFKNLKRNAPSYNKNLKLQQDLRLQFKHVDDSLFAMSLRNPKITENVTAEIGNVHYNIDKSLDAFVEAQVAKGTSHQQYAIAAANRLADMLSEVMNNMQMQMQMPGAGGGKPSPGQGQGMQLPDIIKKQQGLGEKMKDGMKDGKNPGDKEGQGQKPGEKGKEGQQGQGKGEKGKGKGKEGSGGSGSGQGEGSQGDDGEGDAREIMEIYKEQRQLREALQRELNKQGLGGQGQNAMDQMKQIEKRLLNKGFDNETLQKILNVKYELLKLEKAVQQQGEEKKRQSETNRKEFNNQSNALPKSLQDYLNSIEILNRQSLPLRSNYNQKVQEYFKGNDKL
ncbi:DUF4175 family protein [Flavobacterium selenitireducens]|uniref:DUF4175 family protein n=1 Tax=Flavobacterium selenitireducens TaxID=2722704 RepID=UPI00168BB9EC|nr:DUF4175 family protein [Flavobacterium selenitireducens]MBD3583753.1 hypothetical protein [Flavobacterium selenitireducens]